MQFNVETIDIPNIDTYVGTIPAGFDLVVYDKGAHHQKTVWFFMGLMKLV